MLIREEIEEREKQYLSRYACLSSQSKGRRLAEKECKLRTAFQRDRDRIIHSKAFRRLKHKTQVFISPIDDHYRTRLTHALEVSQIARTIARALKLNEDLTEAITLGHDLGHTPFGHTGERILNKLLNKYFDLKFKHNEQSLRVVDFIERDGKGLNLTFEVRNGILRHPWSEPAPATLEGLVARYADRLAYINHDIDDSLRAKVILQMDLPREPLRLLGNKSGKRFDIIIEDLVAHSQGKNKIRLSPKINQAVMGLYKFLFQKVYFSLQAKEESKKACNLMTGIFKFYLENPARLPNYKNNWRKKEIGRKISDYIAGMTDRYAINKFQELSIPGPFAG